METKLTELTFGVDCDEVLRPVLSRMVKLYNKWTDASITEDDVKDFDVEKSFPLVREKLHKAPLDWFFQEHEDYIFSGEPLQETIDALNGLYEIGRVVIVTNQRSMSNRIQTMNWLEKYGFKYDSICFTSNKSDVKCTYLIDDNQLNFVGSCAPVKVLITAPYNKEYEPDLDTDLLRVNNISEFYHTIASNLVGLTRNTFLRLCVPLYDGTVDVSKLCTAKMMSQELGQHLNGSLVTGYDATYEIYVSHSILAEKPTRLVITDDLDYFTKCDAECLCLSGQSYPPSVFVKRNGHISSYDMSRLNICSYFSGVYSILG